MISYIYKLRVLIHSHVTRPIQLTDVRALLTTVTTSLSTITIDYTHSIEVRVSETVADDVLTSGQLYAMRRIQNV